MHCGITIRGALDKVSPLCRTTVCYGGTEEAKKAPTGKKTQL